MGRLKGSKNKRTDIAQQSYIVAELEKSYMNNKRNLIYIACEHFDFVWNEHDLIRFKNEWDNGASIFELCETFNRPENELALLILDLSSKGFIEQRIGGVFGHANRNRIV
jgi:hypothetical protein